MTVVPSASLRVSVILPLRPGTVPNCHLTLIVPPTARLLALLFSLIVLA